jgi:hypothetical protein
VSLLPPPVFCVQSFTGQPSESEEMAPVWVAENDIPYEQMWSDDVHWYPLFLRAGRCFCGLFAFTQSTMLLWHRLLEVPDTSLGAVSAQQLLEGADS